MSAANYLEKYVRALMLGNQLWAARPSTLYLSLHTGDPTDGTSAELLATSSTEISGKGYSRISIACSNSNWTIARNVATNALAISGGASATADWGSITHWGLYDAASRGNLLFHGAFAEAKSITQYGSASFAAGEISIEFAGGVGEVMAFKVLRYLFQAASWTNVSTHFLGLGTAADQRQLYGEPVAIEAASATGYARGTQANTTAKWPASSSNASNTSNATGITNFPTATADWGTLGYEAALDAAIVTGKTWAQLTGATTVTVASVAHGLGSTSTFPANTALGSLSGTYSSVSTAMVVTLPVGHGFNTGDLICLTFSGAALDARYTVTAATDTTVSVTLASGVTETGTVTAAWPLYVDLWFLTSTVAYPTSQRYLVTAITGVDAFTVTAGNTAASDTTGTLVYSAANVLHWWPLSTPITVNSTDTTSLPAGGVTMTVD